MRQCRKLDDTLPYGDSYLANPIVITKDERYIIVVDMDQFCILDLMTMKWSLSRIKSPENEIDMAIIIDNKTEDELLVNGFIRKYNNLYNINIPVAIIGVCAGFYATEYIHGMNDNGDHWKIEVNGIIQQATAL